MKRNPVPSYLRHGQKDQARAVWTLPNGQRKFKLLPGRFNSPESKTAYARLIAEVAASPMAMPTQSDDPDGITISELFAAYKRYAETYYRTPDGKPTNEFRNIGLALRPVRELYDSTPAKDFGPLALKAVRNRIVKAGIVRTQVNKQIDRIRRAFKWAAGEELLPASVYEALRLVPGLRAGRSEAEESEAIKPIDDTTVKATLPLLPRHIRAMVELMACTGMRPGEVCGMTLNQIERGPAVWIYRPRIHKTSHIGKHRMIPLGPRGKEILSAFLGTQILDPDEPIFSPSRCREERYTEMRAARKSKVTPSQICRKKSKPKWVPGRQYTPMAIAHAIRKAINIENIRRKQRAGREGRKLTDSDLLEVWNPYRLRHSFATKVRREHGLEAAQVLLGHSRADVTQTYAERNETLAVNVAAKIG